MASLHPGQPGTIEALASLFADGPAAVLTGAGISTDSGIPDYRGAGTPPRTPMNISQFMHDEAYRRRFWAGASIGLLRSRGIAPNAGHIALARLESVSRIDGVITQNVDGLHRRAGSRSVVELHGSGGVIRCTECDHRWSREDVLDRFDELNPGFTERNAAAEIAPDGDALVTEVDQVVVPPCPICGGLLRPDVVYFGELVPTPVFAAAEKLVHDAGALLLAGTSLAVNTGMRLVHRAERRGIPIAVINRGPTAVDSRDSVRVRIEGGTSETLTALAEMFG
ncbi:Sir2 family NAD-dependent protein deacetylase [Leucobacter celer]|uniref:Sir2 family NAD-dependent protein deacetylase n=1 Tax=Leucobacter celer TaxID=668625 RepID=UPI0006A7AEDB|nr:Sir2 family NAD-dependent protein deacetylase [Leucobacter celer]